MKTHLFDILDGLDTYLVRGDIPDTSRLSSNALEGASGKLGLIGAMDIRFVSAKGLRSGYAVQDVVFQNFKNFKVWSKAFPSEKQIQKAEDAGRPLTLNHPWVADLQPWEVMIVDVVKDLYLGKLDVELKRAYRKQPDLVHDTLNFFCVDDDLKRPSWSWTMPKHPIHPKSLHQQ